MPPLTLARRTMLKTAAAGGGLVAGAFGPASAADATNSLKPVGRQVSCMVAAVQTDQSVSDLSAVVGSTATQVDADLFVVNGMPQSDIGGLVETAQYLRRHIAVSMPNDYGLVLTPGGRVLMPHYRREPVVSTDLGKFVFGGPGAADIAILRRAVGYDRRRVSDDCVQHDRFTVALTSSQSQAAAGTTATAIFGCDGRILTQTAPQWTQAVVAALPLRRPVLHS